MADPLDGFDSGTILRSIAQAPPRPVPASPNLDAAEKELKLTPQEKALYERHLINLGSGGVPNKDGTTSTLYQTSTEIDGKVYNIPTVWDGKILDPNDAIDRALKEGIDKFPSYGSEKEAEDRYAKMHEFMEKDILSPVNPLDLKAGDPVFRQTIQQVNPNPNTPGQRAIYKGEVDSGDSRAGAAMPPGNSVQDQLRVLLGKVQ